MNVLCRRLATAALFGSIFQGAAAWAEPVSVTIASLDPRFGQLVATDAVLEKIADGFTWIEGPVWNKPGGYRLFSDIPANVVYQWKPGKGVSLFLNDSGYRGTMPFPG